MPTNQNAEIKAAIARRVADRRFVTNAKRIIQRDREILKRLAR